MKESHPEIDRKQCKNLRPHRTQCNICKDICPYGEEIFTRPNLVKNWEPCTDCGLCVANCPSQAIAPSPEQVQRDTAAADSNNDTIWIGCERSARKNDVVRSCICALPWEALAYLALHKKLVLDLTPCGECENDLCAERLRGSLTRLVEFFGEAVFGARFTCAYEEGDAPYRQKVLSRREMFGQVTDGSKAGTRKLLQLLPGMEDEERGRSLDFRLMLNHRTKQLRSAMENPLHYGFYLPTINDKCYGCERCVRACRAGALKQETLDNGQSRIVLTPWKCSECGLCVGACSSRAMTQPTLRQVTSLGPVSLHRLTIIPCPQCGKPVPKDSPDGLCTPCRIKAKSKERQEQAAERARQRMAEREAKKAAEEAEKAAAAQAAEAAAAEPQA